MAFSGITHSFVGDKKQGDSDYSEEVGLAHDTHELLLRDLAITITISLLDHLVDLVVGHVLSELLGDTLEVSERDLACLIIIEESEGLDHLISWVSLRHLGGHHVEELVVVDDTAAVLVDILNHLLDLLSLGLETKGSHGDLEFLLVDVARAVSVEEIEGLLDLLLLLIGDVSGLLWSSSGLGFV